MPVTPNIPNEGGAFGLYTGADDPSTQFDMPSLERGVMNLYAEGPGKPSTLPNWKYSWNFPGPFQILCVGDSLVKNFPIATVPWSHRLHQILMNMTGLGDGGLGLMLPAWSGDAGSGVTQTGSPPLSSGTQAGAAGYGVANTARNVGTVGVTSYTFNTNNVTWCTGVKTTQTIDVLYIDVGAFGTDVTYKIDGGAVQTLVTAKVLDKQVKSVRIPAGAGPVGLTNAVHSVEIGASGGGSIALVGIIVYSGTAGASGVMVHNAGVGGVTAVQYTGQEIGAPPNSDALNFISKIAPNLMISCLGANDTIQSVPNTSTKAQVSTAYDRLCFAAASLSLDHIFMTPPEYQNDLLKLFPHTTLQIQDVEQIQVQHALTNKNPLLNLRAAFGSPGQYSASGLLGDNVIHPSDAGTKRLASSIYALMMNA